MSEQIIEVKVANPELDDIEVKVEPIINTENNQTNNSKPISVYEEQLQALLQNRVKNVIEPSSDNVNISIDPMDNYNINNINNKINLTPALSETDKKEYKTVKNRIVREIVVPNYYEDVKSTVLGRKLYTKISNHTETLSKLLTGASTIVAFAAGAYTDYTYLSFIAGCIGTVAMVSQQFSTYAKGEVKERTEKANKILKLIGIDSIPNLEEEN